MTSRAQAEVTACPHCGTAVEGPQGTYCCHGCEMAARILSDAGLQSWYETRQQPAPRSTTAEGIAWDRLPTQVHEDGTVSACLALDGLRCASCVWVTEKMLERTAGVANASVSYASGRTELRWDPRQTDLNQLTRRIAALGYTPRPTADTATLDRDLLLRLGVATFGALNVMGLSAALYAGWLDGMDERFAQMFRWCVLLVAAPVVTWSAVPFYRGAWQGLKHGLLHMDLPIALAVGALSVHGTVATLQHQDGYLDSATMLVALLLGGRLLEARGRKRASEAAASLAAVIPRTARKVVGDRVEDVPTTELKPGDQVDLGSGSEVPADGVVVLGRGLVRMAVLTGEARPTAVQPGDRVVAGAVVEEGALRLGVTRSGDDTMVRRMALELASAADAPRLPNAADRLAPAFTGGTLAVGLTTWALVGTWLGFDAGLARAVAVLVVACPCALALSTPLVGASGLGALARRGLLLRTPDTLAALSSVDVVVLDKTGTVTWGAPRVIAASDEALRIAAGLERFSHHPVARAVVEAAVARGIPIPVADEVREEPGVGITGTLDGATWWVRRGGPDRLRVSSEGAPDHWIVLEDQPRVDARQDIQALRATGRQVLLLTGDHEAVAERIGEQVGVDRVIGGVGPSEKVAFLRELQRGGRRVLFVGDGLNDGPALAEAHVGIAMASGVASSVLVADGLLGGDRLAPLVVGLRGAPRIQRRIHASLVRSVLYNVTAVTAAVLGWVNPLVAAVLMPLSSGMVLASAFRVERDVALRPEEA